MRMSSHALPKIIHQVSAVEHRQGEQVENPQADADQRQERQVLHQAHAGRSSGIVGNGQRTADVLERGLARHHAPHHAQRQRRQLPGTLHTGPQAFQGSTLHQGHLGRRADIGADARDALLAVFRTAQIGQHGNLQLVPVTLHQPDLLLDMARCTELADQVAQLRAIVHRGGTHAQHQVTLAQAGSFGGTACDHLVQHGRCPRPQQAQALEEGRIGLALHLAGQRQTQFGRRRAAGLEHLQAHRLVVECGPGQHPAQVIDGPHLFPILVTRGQAQHAVTALHAGHLQQRARRRRCQPCHGLLHAHPVDDSQQGNGKHQIGHGPGRHDGGTRTQRLGIERKVALLGRHLGFALVEHAHIATQRQRANDELRVGTLALPAQDGPAKAHGKAQHLHAAGHGDAVMPPLVHGNQHAQRDHECDYGQQQLILL
jgi:hypothetical protein